MYFEDSLNEGEQLLSTHTTWLTGELNETGVGRGETDMIEYTELATGFDVN